jgi:hypothetical protein
MESGWLGNQGAPTDGFAPVAWDFWHMRTTLPAAVTAALLLVAASPAAAKPTDVNVVNTAANPVPIFSAQPLTVEGSGGGPVETSISGTPTVQVSGTPTVQVSGTPTVQPLPAYYRVDGSISASGTFGGCSSSLFTNLPSNQTFVLTNVEADAEDTVRPEFIVWLRQQTGFGFFTHFMGVPLTQFSVDDVWSGTLGLNEQVTPGSFTAGDISDVFVCLAPGAGDSATDGSYALSGYLQPAGTATSATAKPTTRATRPLAVSNGR